jgi:hypothetical protein
MSFGWTESTIKYLGAQEKPPSNKHGSKSIIDFASCPLDGRIAWMDGICNPVKYLGCQEKPPHPEDYSNEMSSQSKTSRF